MIKRISLLLILGCLVSSPGRADETPDPCAYEYKHALDSRGKPEYAQASLALGGCQARASEQKKKQFAETAETWANGLDPLTSGGWSLLGWNPDGTSAVFGSRRHETRKGSVVAVWMRYEYRERQSSNSNGAIYKSAVERELYDCERITQKTISVVYHDESNLNGTATSYTYEEDKVAWEPIPPGTLADQLLDWACKNHPFKPQPAKSQ